MRLANTLYKLRALEVVSEFRVSKMVSRLKAERQAETTAILCLTPESTLELGQPLLQKLDKHL